MKDIHYYPDKTDAENARINNVSQTAIRAYRKRNGIEKFKSRDFPKGNLNDEKVQKRFWHLITDLWFPKIATYALRIAQVWGSKTCDNVIADIQLEIFHQTQRYWDPKKYTLEKYVQNAIYNAARELKKKYGIIPLSYNENIDYEE